MRRICGAGQPLIWPLWRAALLCVAWTICGGSFGRSDEPKPAGGKSDDVVAATVGDDPIHLADVARSMRQSLGGRPIADTVRPELEAQALELLIGKNLILRRLKRERITPDAKQLEGEIARQKRAATARFATFEEFLADQGHTAASFRAELNWRLAWQKYLDRNLGDEQLMSLFERRKTEYDGTELKVSHILFPMDKKNVEASIEKGREAAAALRARLADGKLKFADAAKEFSSGPSKANGGDLGFIARRDDMPESFAAAAFALKVGEVSPPVVTQAGVHLITVTEVRPGKREWTAARNDLMTEAIRELFGLLSAEERKQVKVTYTGKSPHLDPVSGELIAPQD